MTNVTQWMSWEGGVDLAAVTSPDLQMPNVKLGNWKPKFRNSKIPKFTKEN